MYKFPHYYLFYKIPFSISGNPLPFNCKAYIMLTEQPMEIYVLLIGMFLKQLCIIWQLKWLSYLSLIHTFSGLSFDESTLNLPLRLIFVKNVVIAYDDDSITNIFLRSVHATLIQDKAMAIVIQPWEDTSSRSCDHLLLPVGLHNVNMPMCFTNCLNLPHVMTREESTGCGIEGIKVWVFI